MEGSDAAYAFSLHLVGMWLTFALSALLITSFVSLAGPVNWPHARPRWPLHGKPSSR
ncbi:hypothetical protein [Aquitalea pelogenes]|uniref:hypothetical protein n=1 Tax=Aquitalea pelogenes TaxID=1293573 RepID=UPI001EFB4BAE|nr:hypothetical protein [Aquitalea pelogenes]